MPKVRKTVSVHEKTVKKVAAKKLKPVKRTARKIKRKVYSSDVTILNKYLVEYIRVMEIHISRIEVIDCDTIIVHNPKES